MKDNTLWQLFYSFFKIGAFTVGGGYAMLPIIEKEVVTKYNWVKKEDWLDMIVLAQTAPGILAMNISILVGQRTMGRRGAVVAAFGSAIPSFITILAIAIFMSKVDDNVYVQKIFKTIRPAVVALIAVPVFSLGKSANVNRYSIFYVIAVAVGIAILGVSPMYIIVGAIITGIIWTIYLQKHTKDKE